MTTPGTTLNTYRERIERVLDDRLPAGGAPERLHQAMRYATLGGGKRVRACLVYATGEALGAALTRLDPAACAVELVHAYSLAHDDLPCMDDDDLRRGRPTCHKAFDEATALLAGDALQSLAFALLSGPAAADIEPVWRLRMVETLAAAIGAAGMAGGQAIDLAAVGRALDVAALQDMHERKTGALIRASVRLGALAAQADDAKLAALDSYARCIGLAFQIVDDILDVEGDTAVLGKTAGADQARGKPTYPALLGLEGARERARALHRDALESLAVLGDNGAVLAGLADFILERTR